MNKKGFTLIELIAVITLIAIVAVIATPNVVKMVDNGKKEQFVSDAKELISKAKYMSKLDKYQGYFVCDDNCCVINASQLDVELENDGDGNPYDLTNSGVKRCLVSGTYVYYVKTRSTGVSTRGVVNVNEGGNSLIDNGYVEEKDIDKTKVVKLP